MKSILIFVAGVIVGVLCLYAWQGYQFQRITMCAPMYQTSLGDSIERQSFSVAYGKPLRVEKIGTGEIFTLTLTRRQNGNIGYTWINGTDKAKTGEGELYEKYEKVPMMPSGNVKDVGSCLRIQLTDVALEWSAGSTDSGYIYYSPRRVTLAYQTED